MNDFVTQRFDLAKRLQFKVRLGSCYLCSDVYHREREFLVFAVEELGRTEHSPPVDSLDGLSWEKFVDLFGADEVESKKRSSYQDCFQNETVDEADKPISSYLSSFSLADLSLVNEERLRRGLASLPSPERTVMVLYLMGARSYDVLAEKVVAESTCCRELLFLARRRLQIHSLQK